MSDEDPPVRLILAALFHAARIVAKPPAGYECSHAELIKASLDDADELLRQAPPS
jgi:hypothetical protein